MAIEPIATPGPINAEASGGDSTEASGGRELRSTEQCDHWVSNLQFRRDSCPRCCVATALSLLELAEPDIFLTEGTEFAQESKWYEAFEKWKLEAVPWLRNR